MHIEKRAERARDSLRRNPSLRNKEGRRKT